MKKHLLLITLMAVALQGIAQKSDTARVLIHFKFTHIRDTTDRAHPYTENMVLFVGKNASAYKSYDGIVANAQFRKTWEETPADADGRKMVNRRGAGSRTEYYQFPNDQKFFTIDALFANSYLIEGAVPAIDWKITGDTATFGGLHCQKATSHFKGRDYIVWFCPDLPTHTGPWKLNGLPGVIVDAHDATNSVVFKFDGVEKAVPAPQRTAPADEDLPPILHGLYDDLNVIALSPKAIKTTQKEFDKLKAAMEKDPQAFAQAMMAARNATMPADGPKPDQIRIKLGPRPVVINNNPIELPETR
jgi:GLPGLI family protein